ncbi:MAG: NADH:flavin oxidoreductase/NADH oxidase family protein [Pseudomonadota bacterium]
MPPPPIAADISSPLTLPSGLELPNRLVKAAMTERIADARNGATERHVALYSAWAEGGIGLQLTGNVQVDRRNLEAPGNVVIDAKPSNEQAALLARWAEGAKAHGGKIMMQLSHAGRQTMKFVNPQPDAPSATQVGLPGGKFGVARAMSGDQIKRVIERFGLAARAAREAGFDGAQLHGAHGYLISQFLSPLVNKRDDEWGGPLENRARLLIEAVKAVKAEAGTGFAVSVKLNSADFQKGGFSTEDSAGVIARLNKFGLDFLEISGGNYEQPSMIGAGGLTKSAERPEPKTETTKKREAYFLDYAQEVRGAATMPIMVTGGFRTASVMNEALQAGEADLIGIGRPLCVEFDAPAQLISGALDALPRWEDRLRIGPGLLSASSPITMVRMLNAFGRQAWFYAQMHRVADGKPVDRSLGVLKTFIAMEGYDARMAKAYHAALKDREAA